MVSIFSFSTLDILLRRFMEEQQIVRANYNFVTGRDQTGYLLLLKLIKMSYQNNK